MKIALIGPAHPYRGGIADFTHALTTALEKDKHACEIFTFTMQYPGFLFPGKTQFAEGQAPVSTKISRLIHSLNPISWIKTAREIKKFEPDLIITHYWMPFMAPALGTILRLSGSGKEKRIALTHNIIPHEKFPATHLLNRFFLKSNRGFIAMSQAVLADLERYLTTPHKIFTPHPIYNHFGPIIPKDKAKEKLQLSKHHNYLLFFGIIRQYKGLDLLIEAMAELKGKYPKLKALVAGEFYEDKSRYLNLIKEQQLTDQFIITDSFVAAEDIKYYFSAADIVVQPYRTATQSGVTQIGYHFERPMIVTNVGGLAEIIPHNKVGYVCETDAKSVAHAIDKFYRNNKEATFVQGVIDEKKKYSWEIMVNKIKELKSDLSNS